MTDTQSDNLISASATLTDTCVTHRLFSDSTTDKTSACIQPEGTADRLRSTLLRKTHTRLAHTHIRMFFHLLALLP